MSLKKQILICSIIAIGISLKIYATLTNTEQYFNWKMWDLGGVIIGIVYVAYATKDTLVCIAMWLLLSLYINAAITSWFYDVTKFEINQKVMGWVMAAFVFLLGVVYNLFEYILGRRVRKKNELCKKDARDKYRLLIDRISNMEKKLDSKTNLINEFMEKLSHG